MSLSWIDILFLVTVGLLAFNGLRNGLVFSLVNLISIPVGIGIALLFGPQLTRLLAANNLPSTPLISYIVLFFGTVLVLHIVGTAVRNVTKKIPLVGLGDALLGAAVGFVEAWLIWLILLLVLGNFLNALQNGTSSIPGLKIEQLHTWHDFYNDAITHSIFAQVNGFIVKTLPGITIPKLPS